MLGPVRAKSQWVHGPNRLAGIGANTMDMHQIDARLSGADGPAHATDKSIQNDLLTRIW